MPKVSIIINCHNGDKYLQEAINSIYAQTYQNWEIIFYDNVSTDRSADIARLCDARLKYYRGENLVTLGAARKAAVLIATGEWIAFLDCDDRWYPNKLEVQLTKLEGTDYVLCYAGIREITENGQKLRDICPHHQSGNIVGSLLRQFDINMVTPMFRREIVFEYGLNFDENITASEEYNLFIRIAAKGKVLVQSVILGDYRVYPGSLTDRQISKWAFERHYTLNQVKRENPGIEQHFLDAFKEAESRGMYYEARYLASDNRYIEARRVLKSIARVDLRYFLLHIIIYFPFLWNFIHSIHVRRFLLKFANTFTFKNYRV
jgi:glycosyltransferase involved in cell wall biosynthesis